MAEESIHKAYSNPISSLPSARSPTSCRRCPLQEPSRPPRSLCPRSGPGSARTLLCPRPGPGGARSDRTIKRRTAPIKL